MMMKMIAIVVIVIHRLESLDMVTRMTEIYAARYPSLRLFHAR